MKLNILTKVIKQQLIKKTKVKSTEKNVDLPMKKFANITGEVKNGLAFLLNKFIKECQSCYIDNKRSLLGEDQVLNQICTYATSQVSLPIAPVIIRSAEILDIEALVEGNYANCLKQLAEKIRPLFKDKEDKSPEKQLGTIVDAFIKFMKIVAIYMTDILYEKRQAVNGVFLFGILRQINSQLRQHDCKIEDELFDNLREYIEVNKPKKDPATAGKKKKKSGEDDDELDADEEEPELDEEEEKPANTKKPRGRPKSTKTKASSPKSAKAEVEESLDVEDEVNKLEDEEWNDEAEYDG